MRWAGLRAWGQDALPLSEVIRWEVERGTHEAWLTAGGARLLREYLVLRDWPQSMAEARAVKEARAKRGS